MAQRVLATQAAEQAANQLVPAIQQLRSDIAKIQNLGKTLTNQNEWDGPDAVKFRATWDSDVQRLSQTDQQMAQLEQRAKAQIVAIRQAGGAN
ncbi:MAG: hypothetical protein J2P45_09800 [Candidatus Dormibacteraeota bacterium]|nr:hypothetical protein [Candidatus Dormibacteraeota bacterium]